MFHFLIVEDQKVVLKELVRSFSQWFPDSKIDTAETSDDALQLIETAYASRWPYDAAILDMLLPRQMGLNPEMDGALCAKIGETMPDTLVIHVTGIVSDAGVWENFKNFHQDRGDSRWIIINKADVGSPDELRKTAKAYLYGGMIEERMNNLFGSYLQATYSVMHRAARSGTGNHRSITLELADLSREIVAHWDDLDEKLQGRIKRIFTVDTSRKPIHISLLG